MENELDSKVPLLEDIETAVPVNDSDGYPIKPTNESKKCKWKKCCKRKKCIKRVLKKLFKLALLLGLIFASVAAVAGFRWYKMIAREVKHWTVTEPNTDIPVIDNYSEDDVKAFQAEAKTFWDTIQAGKTPKDFTATSDDLNSLAASSDYLRGNAFAELKSNKVQIQMSLPTDFLPGGKGRFLVGTETIAWDPETSMIHLTMEPDEEEMKSLFDVQLHLTQQEDDKTMNLEVVSGTAMGWTIPSEFIDEHINLLEDLYHCDCHDKGCKKARKFLEALTEVSMEDGDIVVRANVPSSDKKDYAHRSLRKAEHYHAQRHHHAHGKGFKLHMLRKLLAY